MQHGPLLAHDQAAANRQRTAYDFRNESFDGEEVLEHRRLNSVQIGLYICMWVVAGRDMRHVVVGGAWLTIQMEPG